MATPAWQADIEVTEALIKTCIEQQFPALKPIKKICYISEGWDNKIYLINNQIIFRFPHRKIAAELIVRENTLLNQLQNKLNLTIPHPLYIGKPSPSYPYAFHGYHQLIGEPVHESNLSDAEREASLPIMAKFLKALHSISEKQALEMGAKPQVFDRTDIERTIAILESRVTDVVDQTICDFDMLCFKQEIDLIKNLTLDDTNHVLVHGDLYCRHLLFNNKKLQSIIDWGDVGINNPAVDLSLIFSVYPKQQHAIFLAIYGEVEPQTWQYARFLGLYSALTVLLYAHDANDTALFNEVLQAVKRINPDLIKGEN